MQINGGSSSPVRAEFARPAVDSWLGAIDRAIRVVFCFSSAALVVAQCLCFFEGAPISGQGVGLLVGMLAGMTLLATVMIGRRESGAWAVGSVSFICLLYLVGAIVAPEQTGTGVWWMGVTAPVVAAFIVLASPRLLVVPTVTAYVLVYLVAQILRAGPGSVGVTVVAGGGILAGAAAVGVAARELRRGAALTDAETARRRAKRRQEMELSALITQARWVDRLLHDEVVHALRAVSLSGNVSESEIREVARGAAARLAGAAEPADEGSSTSLDAGLRELADASGLGMTMDLERVIVPGEVARAISASVREALRNIRLHSGVEVAGMQLTSDAGKVVVTVTDAGCGFDATAPRPGHVGIVSSISQRMRDIGGCALFDSSQAGTAVTLSWQPRAVAPPYFAGAGEQLIGARRAVAFGCSAFVLLDAVQAAIKFPGMRHPWPATVATVVVLAAWLGTLKALRAGHFTRRWSAGLMVVAPVCTAVAALSLPAQSRDGTDYWLACGTVPLVLVVVLLRPVRESWWGAVLAVITPLLCVVAQGCTMGRLVDLGPAVLAPIYVVPAGYLMVIIVDRLAGHAAREWDRALRSAQRVEQLRRREQVLVARLSDLREQVLPLLAAIGDGRVELDDAEIVRKAAHYEAQVRDQIGGRASQLPVAAAAALSMLRAAGATVETRVDKVLSDAEGLLVQQGLAALVDVCRSGMRVTVTAHGRTVSLVAAPLAHGVVDAWLPLASDEVELCSDQESFAALRTVRVPAPEVGAGQASPALSR